MTSLAVARSESSAGPFAGCAATAPALAIGGITPLTTVDYPGELAAVVFCQGCPWRCGYCHNGHLLEFGATTALSCSEVMDFLARRVGLLDAVVFSGGEPTGQTGLAAAIADVRHLGLKVGLHTNGAYRERLVKLLPLIDWVGLDIKALPQDYAGITGVASSGEKAWDTLRFLLSSEIALEVRTTRQPYWSQAEMRALAVALADVGVRNYCLQDVDRTRARVPSLNMPMIPFSDLVAAVPSQRFDLFYWR